MLAAVGYAIGPMIIKHRFADLDPLGPVTASMGVSMVLIAPRGRALGADGDALGRHDRLRARARAGVQRLAFLLFFALINTVGPARATVITYINPVVAVTLGMALLGERLGPERRRRAAAHPRRARGCRRAGGCRPASCRASRPRGRPAAPPRRSRSCAPAPCFHEGVLLSRRELITAAGAAWLGLRATPAGAMPPPDPPLALRRGIDLTPNGIIRPGSPQDYRVLRAQPWAAPLIARMTHLRILGRLADAPAAPDRSRPTTGGPRDARRAGRRRRRRRAAGDPDALPLPALGERDGERQAGREPREGGRLPGSARRARAGQRRGRGSSTRCGSATRAGWPPSRSSTSRTSSCGRRARPPRRWPR